MVPLVYALQLSLLEVHIAGEHSHSDEALELVVQATSVVKLVYLNLRIVFHLIQLLVEIY